MANKVHPFSLYVVTTVQIYWGFYVLGELNDGVMINDGKVTVVLLTSRTVQYFLSFTFKEILSFSSSLAFVASSIKLIRKIFLGSLRTSSLSPADQLPY